MRFLPLSPPLQNTPLSSARYVLNTHATSRGIIWREDSCLQAVRQHAVQQWTTQKQPGGKQTGAAGGCGGGGGGDRGTEGGAGGVVGGDANGTGVGGGVDGMGDTGGSGGVGGGVHAPPPPAVMPTGAA